MVNKEVTKIQQFCDTCEQDTWGGYDCLGGCGKTGCYDCCKDQREWKLYKHGVHFSGSGDGVYCTQCINRLLEKRDPLLIAYKDIERLRNEGEVFYNDWNLRCKVAEKQAERLYEDAKQAG